MRKIFEEVNTDWLYMNLKMFEKGHLENSNIRDPLIREVKSNGIVELYFNASEYIDILDLPEEDKEELKSIFNEYYRYGREYKDFYSSMDDWREGYLLHLIYSDNKILLEEIKSIFLPHIDLDNGGSEFWDFLSDNFESEVRSIVDSYNMCENAAIEEAISKAAKEELCDIYMPYGIYTVKCFIKYKTTVKKLIELFEKYKCARTDIAGLLRKIVEEDMNLQTGFSEYWEFDYNDYLDASQFNRDLKNELENILEKIEDTDVFTDLEKFREITKNLKYDYGVWYELPKNKSEKFQIRGVDPKTNKIIFIDMDKYGEIQNRKLDYEDFMNFLYHPELF